MHGKSQLEKDTREIQDYIAEHCDWDQVYIELSTKNNDDWSVLWDTKKLASYLAKDTYFDWTSALG